VELDIAIIGGSSAGFYAAELLAARGRRVAVFERRNSLSHSRRTLIVTSELERVTGPVPTSVRLEETRIIKLVCQEKSADVSLLRPDPVVERAAFVHWMHDRAVKAGAEVFWGTALTGVSLKGGSACLEFSGRRGPRQVRAREAIIGADGARSNVAASTGIPRPGTVSILQAEVALPEGWDTGTTQVSFNAEETSFFYWLIPESPGKAVAGVIEGREDTLPVLLRSFLLRHGLSPLAYQGAAVAMYRPGSTVSTRVGGTRVCLVGDAAGQVKVTTVGGTVSGLLGSEAAVRSILRRSPYARELKSLTRELDLHWMMRKVLNRLDNAGYKFLLSSLSGSVQQFLARNNRDSMAPVLWKLLLVQPTLLLVAWRALSTRRIRARSAALLRSDAARTISSQTGGLAANRSGRVAPQKTLRSGL